MANENLALAYQQQPVPVIEDDYQSFCETLSLSARGRAFLAEYARRNRHSDTEVVLNALARFKEAVHSHQVAPEAERLRQEMRALLGTIRSARPQADNNPSAIKAATLSSLLDFVQRRLESLSLTSPELMPFTLSQVPESDQPELPIPNPVSVAPPAFSLVSATSAPTAAAPQALVPFVTPPSAAQLLPQAPVPLAERDAAPPETYEIFSENFAPPEFPRVTKTIPEIDFIACAPVRQNDEVATAATPAALAPADGSDAPARETAIEALAAMIAFAEPAVVEASVSETEALTIDFVELDRSLPAAAMPADQPADPLADIMALTEEERLALFT